MSISISGSGGITGATTSYSFDQSVSIGGTLTYEDVTNIDSVGVITARSGINVGPTSGIGITLTSGGNITAAGNLESSYLKVVASPLQTSGGLVRIDGSTDRVIELNYDGSALFKAPTANGVEVQTVGGNEGTKFPFVGKNTSGTITFKVNGDGKIQSGSNYLDGDGVNIFAGGSIYIRQDGATGGVLRIRNGSDYKIELNGDGSATFAGNIVSSAGNVQGFEFIGTQSTATFGVFKGKFNSTVTTEILADGTATFKNKLTVRRDSATPIDTVDIYNGTSGGDNRVKIRTVANGGGDPYLFFDGGGNNMVVGLSYAGSTSNELVMGTGNSASGVTGLRINGLGAATFDSSLSKASGSFKIDHPLPIKTETHHLVHSFIEGPQADLIYRGVVDLVDGTATVNIDTAGRMTEGTFAALCTNVSCFTSNESDWTAVRGSVSGSTLTIEAQDNTSTATVSWMVVGERKDQHMIDTEWTDENGRVITEPLKS